MHLRTIGPWQQPVQHVLHEQGAVGTAIDGLEAEGEVDHLVGAGVHAQGSGA
ncbi:MAG: hypothetical protein ACUVR2_12440 [Anaerolineae bacterium]